MPRVFTIDMLDEQPTDEMFDDENFDPYQVAPEAFQYLPAPELGGPRGPVRVAVRPTEAGSIDNGPTMIDKLLGRKKSAHDAWEVKAERAAARIGAAMRELGAVRAYFRYDGGNDEGFAWFDHCIFKDSSTRDADRIAKDLEGLGVEVGMDTFGGRSPMRNALDDVVAAMWSASLLGGGYGTGEYVMYGAFWVDLETGMATDDPNPAPIVQNIALKAP